MARIGMNKIKCNSINYRKGYIEVTGNIHEGHVNIEAWRIHPDTDISGDMSFEEISDEAFTSNTELELTLENAEELVKALQGAIRKTKETNSEA